MPLSQVLLLALVQGLTEFLPVSSSGHLLVVRLLFGIPDIDGQLFDAFLHLGTLMAVLVYYWNVWWGIARSVARNDVEGKDKRELFAKLSIATVPAAIAGYLFENGIAEYFRGTTTLAVSLLTTAALLVVGDMFSSRRLTLARVRFSDAVLIGLAQVVALVPGISRSGVTMAAGRVRGLSRTQATKFSFLMSAPIIAGASLHSLAALLSTATFPLSELWWGFVVSFLSGLLAIWFLMKVVERISFIPFALYLCLVAGYLFYVG